MKKFGVCCLASLMAVAMGFVCVACGGSGGDDSGNGNVANLTGNWACHITTPDMDENTTLQLVQDGETLTGFLGEIPITGTVIGTAVEIYAAGDSAIFYLHGTVNDTGTEIGGIADVDNAVGSPMASGTWQATR